VLIDSVLHGVDSLFESGVPVVLDSIVGSAHKFLADEAPFLIALVSENEEHPLFFLRPFGSFDFGVKVIEPPFSARFT
jgi:hypothetical protein